MRIINLVKLDFLTIKPYLKNIGILIALILFFSVQGGESFSFIGMAGAYIGILASYPFSVGEKSNLDGLYCTLPVRRKDIVIARFAYAFTLQSAIAILMAVAAVVMGIYKGAAVEMGSLVLNYATSFLTSALIVSIQYPFFFKSGYNANRGVTILPLFVVLGLIYGLVKVLDMFNAMPNLENITAWHIVALLLGLGIFVIGVSMFFSLKFYEKRDF